MNRATILTGVGGGLLLLLLLAPATGTALGKLNQAREARALAIAAASAPPVTVPLVAPGSRIGATDRAGAARAVAQRVAALAAQGGVLVEQARPVSTSGSLVRMRISLSGPDKAVIALVDRIERDAPLIRFDRWSVTAIGDGGLRVEGEALATWR